MFRSFYSKNFGLGFMRQSGVKPTGQLHWPLYRHATPNPPFTSRLIHPVDRSSAIAAKYQEPSIPLTTHCGRRHHHPPSSTR